MLHMFAERRRFRNRFCLEKSMASHRTKREVCCRDDKRKEIMRHLLRKNEKCLNGNFGAASRRRLMAYETECIDRMNIKHGSINNQPPPREDHACSMICHPNHQEAPNRENRSFTYLRSNVWHPIQDLRHDAQRRLNLRILHHFQQIRRVPLQFFSSSPRQSRTDSYTSQILQRLCFHSLIHRPRGYIHIRARVWTTL